MDDQVCLGCGGELVSGKDLTHGFCQSCREKGVKANKRIIRKQERGIRERSKKKTPPIERNFTIGGGIIGVLLVLILLGPRDPVDAAFMGGGAGVIFSGIGKIVGKIVVKINQK